MDARGLFRGPFHGLRAALRAGAVAAVIGVMLPAGAGVSGASPPAADQQDAPLPVGALRERARAILSEVQEQGLALSEARRRVELLLRDLEALGEAEGWSPLRRRLEITIARPEEIGPALAETCPLFFEEELVRLCPLDQARSEIWGSRVLVCAFACAPERP